MCRRGIAVRAVGLQDGTHVKAVRAEGPHVEEKVSVGLHAMQRQVDRDQDELALYVLVRHGAAVALREREDVSNSKQ